MLIKSTNLIIFFLKDTFKHFLLLDCSDEEKSEMHEVKGVRDETFDHDTFQLKCDIKLKQRLCITQSQRKRKLSDILLLFVRCLGMIWCSTSSPCTCPTHTTRNNAFIPQGTLSHNPSIKKPNGPRSLFDRQALHWDLMSLTLTLTESPHSEGFNKQEICHLRRKNCYCSVIYI